MVLQDRLWVLWVHEYYMKNQDSSSDVVPITSSWMLRKILDQRVYMKGRGQDFSIAGQYLKEFNRDTKVPWRKLITRNKATSKENIIVWFIFWHRLLTLERLKKWGLVENDCCSVCKNILELLQHVFMECGFAKELRAQVMKCFPWDNSSADPYGEILRVSRLASKRSPTARAYVILWTKLWYAIWINRCNVLYISTLTLLWR